MRSITVAQAALFAALAMMLLTGYYLIDNAAILHENPALVLLGSVVPSMVWTGFFFTVSRRPASVRTAAWITLVFAVLLEAVIVTIRFQQSVSFWTPLGSALSLSGWLLRLGWTAFLMAFAWNQNHPRTRQVALVVAIIAAPPAVTTAYAAWDNWLGLLFDDIPRQALWRVLITPAVRTIYWFAQILFLWAVWGNPEAKRSIESPATRFTP